MIRGFRRLFFATGIVSVPLFALFVGASQSAATPGAASASPSEDLRVLELGKPIERDLAAGEAHIYSIVLSQGQWAGIVVQQEGVDVVVKTFGVNGEAIAESDIENRSEGKERAELVAGVPGSYVLRVESKYKMLPGGRYRIQLAEIRPATEQDRLLQQARELHRQAIAMVQNGNYEQARALEEHALEIREKTIGVDHPDVALSLALLANVAYYQGDLANAESLNQRSIAILEKTLGAEHPQTATRLPAWGTRSISP